MYFKVVLITGVPGVGSSTVVKALQKRGTVPFNYLNFGDIMLRLGENKNYLKDRDQIRKLPVKKQKELQLLSAVEIQERTYQILLVDTHCTIKTPEGYLPGFPRTILEQLDPAAIIIIEAEPKDIANRRKGDQTRKRDIDSPEQIAEHQHMNRLAAISYGVLVGSPVMVIKNETDRLEQAADELEDILKRIGEA